jgi:tetratricopeptide (TPR) repeat protein
VLNNWGLSTEYYLSRDYKNAIEQANKTLQIEPNYLAAVSILSLGYEQMEKYKDALEQWVKLERLQGHEVLADELLHAFQTGGYVDCLRKHAKSSEAEGSYYGGGRTRSAAGDHAMLGEKDAAFALLEKAFVNRTGLVDINVDPRLDKIRPDPRFRDLLHRVGLREVQHATSPF